MIRTCFYAPQGSLSDTWNREYLNRKRLDDPERYLVDRLVYQSTNPETHAMLANERPTLERIGLSNPCFVTCKTSGKYWTGWHAADHDALRLACSPDLTLARLMRDAYGDGFQHFWSDGTGKWLAPDQPGCIVASPDHRLPRDQGGDWPLVAWVETWKRFQASGQFAGFCADMTPGRLSWGEWNHFLNDRTWLWQFAAFAGLLHDAGVKWIENSRGAGPRSTGLARAYKYERFGNQAGQLLDTYGLWAELARAKTVHVFEDGRTQDFCSGLSTLTAAQRAESILHVAPRLNDTDKLMQWKVAAATAHLFDVGYISNDWHWQASEGKWDPHSEYAEEMERWTRLEPVNATRWFRWSRNRVELPDARICVELGDVYGRRLMRDPIGGQFYTLWLNPNDHAVGTMQAREAKLVRR